MACRVLQLSFLILPVLIVAFYRDDAIQKYTRSELSRMRLKEIAERMNMLIDNETNEQQLPMYPKTNTDWQGPSGLGHISGISVDPKGYPVIFHRGDRVWDQISFNDNFQYQEAFRGPISQDTILKLNPKTGKVEDTWGGNIFYMPHGIHIDVDENIWLTDVALHQVFKLDGDSKEVKLVLGQRFQPGNDVKHFCQPTSVAVTSTGEILVADGYCNSRILAFEPSGRFLKEIIGSKDFISLRVPHSLTILPSRNEVCVADRENKRIVCLKIDFNERPTQMEPPVIIQKPEFGRIFGITSYGNYVYAVNGPSFPEVRINGFMISPKTRSIVLRWPLLSHVPFTNPHAVAACPFGSALYVAELEPRKIWKIDTNWAIPSESWY